MLQRILSAILSPFGYAAIPQKDARKSLFVLHSYKNADGSFDYARYRKVQEAGNVRKIEGVWVLEENIAFLANYLKQTIGPPKFGICHGTRRGMEQQWFRKYLGCEVIGTEISKTATEFPHTIQWDFHEVKPEWIGAVDFIYSNSFDHSYDPEKCLNTWMSCVRLGGVCILEHSGAHEPSGADELDPFGADIVLMPYLIATWAKGKFVVRELLSAPAKNDSVKWVRFIVIQKL
jgi:hypothetical protein